MREIADIEMDGHLIDSQMLTRVLDKIMDMGGEFEIKDFRIGQKKNDTSYARITVAGEDAATLDRIPLELHALGARLVEKFDVNYTVPAEIIYPKYYHKRGQLCAAREGDDENPTKASASTDFYITWGRNFSPRQMEYYVEKEKREGAKSYALPSEQLQQGYIKHGGVPHLDNGYTVFGEVLEGMDVVDKIQNVATNKDNNDRPLEDVVITRATQVK